jgi:hypothetical protein
MATNHQVVNEALDALARRASEPVVLALMDRCIGCDSRSASLRGGRCPDCLAYSYELYDIEADDRLRERGQRVRQTAGVER